MQTIGHHTCKKDGGIDYVNREAPFLSEYDPVSGNYPFLGSGYYYWDNNKDIAKWWGENQKKFNKDFFVVESKLNLPTNLFFDLVGNRDHMIIIKELMDKHKSKGYENKKWVIGAFIQFLKRLRVDNPHVFPFQVIRAIDNSTPIKDKDIIPTNEPDNYKFVNDIKKGNYTKKMENYINLNPRLVIFLIEKNSLILQSVKVVYAT